jgi:hypothetical protein
MSIQFDVCGVLEHDKSPHLYAVSKRALTETSFCSSCGGLSWEQEFRFSDKYMSEITNTYECALPYPSWKCVSWATWQCKDKTLLLQKGVTPMFIVALFTIAKLWKEPRCPTTDKWIKKMWYLYTMEFYVGMKKNEMLSFVGKWMELESIILSEIILAQKTKNCMFSLICGH